MQNFQYTLSMNFWKIHVLQNILHQIKLALNRIAIIFLKYLIYVYASIFMHFFYMHAWICYTEFAQVTIEHGKTKISGVYQETRHRKTHTAVLAQRLSALEFSLAFD